MRKLFGRLAWLPSVLLWCACSGGPPRLPDRGVLGPSIPWLDLVAAAAPHSPPPRLEVPLERSVRSFPGGGPERRQVVATRLLLRADLALAPADGDATWARLAAAVDREIRSRGGRLMGWGKYSDDLHTASYSRGDLAGTLAIWHVQGAQATHLAVWVDEER